MCQPEIDYAKHPELDDRLREPLDEEERTLIDPDTWDWDNPVDVVVAPGARLVFEVSLSGDELSHIEPAAVASGMTVIAYLKQAALRSARLSTPK